MKVLFCVLMLVASVCPNVLISNYAEALRVICLNFCQRNGTGSFISDCPAEIPRKLMCLYCRDGIKCMEKLNYQDGDAQMVFEIIRDMEEDYDKEIDYEE